MKRGEEVRVLPWIAFGILSVAACSIVLFSGLFYYFLVVGVVSIHAEESIIQQLDREEIAEELGGIPYSSSCFVSKYDLHKNRCSPQFIIGGVMKGGTTSLYSYLLQHPLILPLAQTSIEIPKSRNSKLVKIEATGNKEIRYFNKEIYGKLTAQNLSDNTIFSHYSDFFPDIRLTLGSEHSARDGYITGEVSPTYLFESGVAERIYKYMPAVKLIFLLRNPVDRAHSEYWFRQHNLVQDEQKMFRYNSLSLSDEEIFAQCMLQDFALLDYCSVKKLHFKENWNESKAKLCYNKITKKLAQEQLSDLENEAKEYCGNVTSPLAPYCLTKEFYQYCNPNSAYLGAYALQIQEYLSSFSPRMIKLIESESFFQDTAEVLSDVEFFLDVAHQPMNWNETVFNMKRTQAGLMSQGDTETSKYPPLSKSTREMLSLKYLFYNRRLETLTKQKFSSWT